MRHRFHAICPYFAMFPESFVEKWVETITRPGHLILDPFCGRGTTPFQAVLMNRRALANDINPVAYCISQAKTNAPMIGPLRRRLTSLATAYRPSDWEKERRGLPRFFRVAYHAETLRQILFLRHRLQWRVSKVDCMLAALMLGILHGESVRSPSYLSNQMPRTISTKQEYSIRFWRRHGLKAPRRSVWELLNSSIAYRYASAPPTQRATVVLGDMRDLPRKLANCRRQADCVITSPPYADITRFEEDQWLRLWFLGYAPKPTYGVISRDDRHERMDNYWGLISDMWRVLGFLCRPRADIVIRIGSKRQAPAQIADGLIGTAVVSGRRVRLVGYETTEIKRRQTPAFRPGSQGCLLEVDCHLQMA